MKGKLDLTDWDAERNSPIHLIGEWEFYWQKLFTPEDFGYRKTERGTEEKKRGTEEEIQEENGEVSKYGHPKKGLEYIRVPSGWNRLEDRAKPVDGYATYRASILLPENVGDTVLALEFPEQSSAFRCFVNGKLIHYSGRVGRTREESEAKYLPAVKAFSPGEDELEIIMQISNFQHRTGGFWAPLSLGAEEELIRRQSLKSALDAFLLGAIIIMGIYHLVLFIMRHEEKAMLFFSLFCFAIAIRLSVTGQFLVMQLFPDFSWSALKKVEFITETISIALFAMFLRRLFPADFAMWMERVFQITAGIYVLLCVFLPVHLLIDTGIVTTILAALLGMYSLFLIIQVTMKKREGSIIFLLGILFLFFGVIYDIIINRLSINSFYLFPAMLVLFFVTQSILLSGRFAKAFSKAERQLENFLLTLASAIESKDQYTGGHVERVANYARDIARLLELSNDETRRIYLGAIIHDIGKLAIPDSILNKKGKLTNEEFNKIKEHTTRGKQLLEKIEDIETAANIALYHQERWDGNGYPKSIRGDNIPLAARITALADYWDAITTDRPYRKAMPLQQALHIMHEERDQAFDPFLFDLFMKERVFIRYLNPRQREEYEEMQSAEVVKGSVLD